MKTSISRNIIIVMVMALGALLVNAAIPINALHQLDKSHNETEDIREEIALMGNVMQSLLDAQNSVRGYAISNNTEFLKPFYKAESKLDDQLKELQRYSRLHSGEHAIMRDLNSKVTAVLEHLEDQISMQQAQGSEATMSMIASGEGKRRMDAVRSINEETRELKQDRLDVLEAHERKIQLYTKSALIALTIFDLILFILAFTLLFNALKTARNTEKKLNDLHMETLKRGEVLALKNKYKNIQARLNDVLQSVISPEEAYAAIQKHGAHLFPGYPGALYIRSNSKDYFERKANWNDGIFVEGFEPEECWAARNNQAYEYNGEHDDLPCPHVKTVSQNIKYSICLPISSRDEMIGIMNLAGPNDVEGNQLPIDPEVRKLADEIVNQIGLAIANLRLRDSLRKSSIVDALTGLYNRRYLDETLPREIARAERAGHSIGIIMLDIDHFKTFNDTHGHDAGDMALREVGPRLRHACRVSDVACRYGGEEFMLILPDANLEATIAKAELIRTEVSKIRFKHGGIDLPGLTASLGVSVYPMHGPSAIEIIKAADEALYAAKEGGRNRVKVASDRALEKTDSAQ